MTAASPIRGTVWPMESKPKVTGYQPCTDTWKIEPRYLDPGILVDNWYEQREQYRHKHEAKRQAHCAIGKSHVPMNTSIYTTSYQNPKGMRAGAAMIKHQQTTINPPIDPSQYSSFKKYTNDINSCPDDRYVESDDVCWYTSDQCQPCSALPQLPQSNTLTTQGWSQSSEKRKILPKMSTIYEDTTKPLSLTELQLKDFEKEKMATIKKSKTMRYRIPPDRGQYPLLERAIEENRYISKYADKHCTTPTYAMRCLHGDCDLEEIAKINQMNKWKTSVINLKSKGIPDLYKECYPVSYNKKINWITPNDMTRGYLTCQ